MWNLRKGGGKWYRPGLMRVIVLMGLAWVTGCVIPERPERSPLSRHIDAVLGPRSHLVEGAVSLGSVGHRLRVDRLARRPGFVGGERTFFSLEIVEGKRTIVFPPLTHQWWPSHVGMEGKAAGLHLVERKFITSDDRVVDLVTLRNETRETRELLLRISSDMREGVLHTGGEEIRERRMTLAPGETISIPVEMVFDGSAGRASSPRFFSDYLEKYNGWFEKRIPDFECPDPWFVKLWYYHWFLVRKSLDWNPIAPNETRWLRGVRFPDPVEGLPAVEHRFGAKFERLFDPDQFWAPFPARLEVGGKVTGMRENVLVLEALATVLREGEIPTVTRRRFFDFLQRMVHAQFEGGDFQRPRVGDFLESDTGKWTTDRRELVEIPYADLLIRFVGGVVPRGDETLEFHPLVDHFSSFRFRGIPYHGAILEIVWDAPDGIDAYGDGVEGYSVRRDGETLFTVRELKRIEWTD